MKNTIKILGALSLLLFTLAGCNNFLDEVPDSRTEIDSPEKISLLLTSAYPKSNYAATANVMGDGVIFRTANAPYTYQLNQDAFFWRDPQDVDQDTPTYFWDACYSAVAAANHALEAIGKMPNPDACRVQKGEALLCRAFSHFLLVNLYAKTYRPDGDNGSMGVPYVDEPETVVIKEYDRKTVGYVYGRIEEDLIAGLKLAGTDADYKVPAYHFTYKAGVAFAVRFYTYKGEWSTAIQYANQLIPVPARDTVSSTGVKNVHPQDAANIWASTYFQAYKTGWAGSADITNNFPRASSKSNFLLAETSSRLHRHITTAIYGTATNTLPSNQVTNITGGYWPFMSRTYSAYENCQSCYKTNEYFFYSTASTGFPYIMFSFLRAEEVLLNRIEAEIMLNNYDAAIKDLNVYYRWRTGSSTSITSAYNQFTYNLTQAKINTYWANSLNDADLYLKKYNAYGAASWDNNKLALMLTLLDTRKAEYVHEGLRWFDILRYKIPITHSDRTGRVNTLLPDDDRRVWQIPDATKTSGLAPNPRENVGELW